MPSKLIEVHDGKYDSFFIRGEDIKKIIISGGIYPLIMGMFINKLVFDYRLKNVSIRLSNIIVNQLTFAGSYSEDVKADVENLLIHTLKLGFR